MKESYEAWHNQLIHRLAALLYAVEDRNADVGAIRESYELVKKSTGLFSAFRGNSTIHHSYLAVTLP